MCKHKLSYSSLAVLIEFSTPILICTFFSIFQVSNQTKSMLEDMVSYATTVDSRYIHIAVEYNAILSTIWIVRSLNLFTNHKRHPYLTFAGEIRGVFSDFLREEISWDIESTLQYEMNIQQISNAHL